MTTKLFQEAIVEAEQLRKVAEDNAKRAVVEAITPRIKRMIEQHILAEDSEVADDEDVLLGSLGDLVDTGDEDSAGMSLPDDEGKVTLDLDAVAPEVSPDVIADNNLSDNSDDEFLLNMESAKALIAITEAAKPSREDVAERVTRLKRSIKFGNHLLESGIGTERKSLQFVDRLCNKMLSEARILSNSEISNQRTGRKKLASDIAKLTKEIREMATRKRLAEVDAMLRLTLPDDVDIDPDELDIDFVQDESDSDEELELDDELESDDTDNEELDMELEGDYMDEADEMEGLTEEDLMLRLTGLPEDEDFDLGGLDIEIVDDEAGDMEDMDMDMDDDMELDLDDEGEEDMEDMDMDMDDDEVIEIDEGMLRRELARMKSIAEGSADDPAAVAAFGGASKDKEAFVDMDDKDLNKHDSVGTVKVESRSFKKLQKESRQNRALRKKVTELSNTVDKLSKQLQEQNLFNAKLLYVNRLVHSKALSEGQLRSVVSTLDKAKSLREAKLLYKGITESVNGRRKRSSSLNEAAHRSTGGSSRSSRSASSTNAGRNTTDRWATLAGISDKN